MIAQLVIATLLAASAVGISAQGTPPSTPASAKAVWPHMHQCTLDAVSRLAIKTKGTSAHRSRGDDSTSIGWQRIDLHLAGSPDGSGGPTISAHAINTKGTGAAGRAVTNTMPIRVACVASQVMGGEALKSAKSSFAFLSADSTGVGWSCRVSGSEDRPVFKIGLLVPTILGQAESPLGKSATSSWGQSSHLSIVARGGELSDSWHVACSSKEPRNTNYDLAVLKKA